MSDFDKLKKNRKSAFDKLAQELEKKTDKNFDDSDRYWKPTVDKSGNGFAIIRFLPTQNEDIPWVQLYSHGFQDVGGWYIENSLTTLGEKDPVSDMNSKLWNTGDEEKRNLVRKRKRRLTYFSNIYVVSDPDNPSNEGKVFLYRYGKKIFEMLNDMMHPSFPDEQPVNPFDLWEGANFKMKIRKLDGYRDYSKSEFDDASPLFDDDEKMEEVYKQTHSLQALIASDQFKSYDELQQRLNRVLGLDGSETVSTETKEELNDETVKTPEPSKSAPTPKTVVDDSKGGDDEEDVMDYFNSLAES